MREWSVSDKNEVTPEYLTPIGFSALSCIRECPLRFAFTRDRNYPPRLHPKARMAVALHEALAFLSRQSPSSLSELVEFFRSAMSKQRTLALRNYRERRLFWPRAIREAMENTLAADFRVSTQVRGFEVWRHTETTIVGRDNLVVGRPDEVLLAANSCVIIDYKTARSTDEAVDSAEDQIHFYAGIWQETQAGPHVTGRIEFLLDNRQHSFPIDEQRAAALVAEARGYAIALQRSTDSLFRAKVGDHCRLCSYRPWCTDYWRALGSESTAESRDISGLVCAEHPQDNSVMCIMCGTSHIIIVNRSVDPLPLWKPGTRVRALDLQGASATRFQALYSELFCVSPFPETTINQ